MLVSWFERRGASFVITKRRTVSNDLAHRDRERERSSRCFPLAHCVRSRERQPLSVPPCRVVGKASRLGRGDGGRDARWIKTRKESVSGLAELAFVRLGVGSPVRFHVCPGRPEVQIDRVFRLIATVEAVEMRVAVLGVDASDRAAHRRDVRSEQRRRTPRGR